MNEQTADLASILTRLREQRTDEDAWLQLYRALWPRVSAIAHRIVRGRRELAEDVAQDVFVRLLRYADLRRFPSADDFLRYVTIVTRNAARDLSKSYQDGPDFVEIPDEVIPEAFRVEASLLAESEGKDLLLKLSRRLNAQDRQLVELLGQGFTLKEIARRLDITYSNAGVRVHRIRRVLAKLLITDFK